MRPPGVIDRGRDRRITVGGAVVAAALLLAAIAAFLLPTDVRRGAWLPLHLALAGGGAIAIAAVLPFFSTTLAAAPPASPRIRIAGIGLVAAGALGAVAGYPSGLALLAAAGALSFVAGMGLVAGAAFAPLRSRRRALPVLVLAGYGVALADVAAGAVLVAVYLAGWPPLVAAWGAGKSAHAWLNLLGFVSGAITTTLVHLLPTILGTRIVVGRPAFAAVMGLAVAAPLVAAGMLLASGPGSDATSAIHGLADLLARLGAAALIAGAASLGILAASTWRSRGRWTTDAGWHRWIVGALGSAVAWFVLSAVLAGGPVLVMGADPGAWSIDIVGPPLVGGWLGLAVLGALVHLLPSIGPGGPVRHARQRTILGRGATVRLAILDAGVLLVVVASVGGVGTWVAVGAAVYALGLASTVVLLAVALAVG